MDYELFIDLDNVTLQDCIHLYEYGSLHTEICDGRIVTFKKECD